MLLCSALRFCESVSFKPAYQRKNTVCSCPGAHAASVFPFNDNTFDFVWLKLKKFFCSFVYIHGGYWSDEFQFSHFTNVHHLWTWENKDAEPWQVLYNFLCVKPHFPVTIAEHLAPVGENALRCTSKNTLSWRCCPMLCALLIESDSRGSWACLSFLLLYLWKTHSAFAHTWPEVFYSFTVVESFWTPCAFVMYYRLAQRVKRL